MYKIEARRDDDEPWEAWCWVDGPRVESSFWMACLDAYAVRVLDPAGRVILAVRHHASDYAGAPIPFDDG